MIERDSTKNKGRQQNSAADCACTAKIETAVVLLRNRIHVTNLQHTKMSLDRHDSFARMVQSPALLFASRSRSLAARRALSM